MQYTIYYTSIRTQKELASPHMRKTSLNFKQLFEKIHQDHLNRGPYSKQPSSQNTSSLLKYTAVNTQGKGKENMKSSEIKEAHCEAKRPMTVRPPSAKIAVTLEKEMENEAVKQYFQYLQKIKTEMVDRLSGNTQDQNETIAKEFHSILELCLTVQRDSQQSGRLFQEFEENISNVLQHRKTRVTFYFIYGKFLECNTNSKNLIKELKMMEKCDSYSRALGNFHISLYSCQRIQKILFMMKKVERSKSYAEKVLRLAVYLKNRFEQYKAIEALKLISFYEGKINSSSKNYLRKQERDLIIKNFHPLQDLAVETESEGNCGGNIDRELIAKEEINANENAEKFVSSMALMKKSLSERSKDVMQTLQKVSRVGSVNKYLESGVCITLQPRSRFMPERNRGQVLLTHSRKKSQTESSRRFHKLYLPEIIQLVRFVQQFKK